MYHTILHMQNITAWTMSTASEVWIELSIVQAHGQLYTS